MDTRRSFFALVGSVALSGPVTWRFGFSRPTLVMPPVPPVIPEPDPATAQPLLTLLHVKRSVPEDAFQSWMFLGLRLAKLYGGREEQVVQAAIEAAVERHGSIIDAMKAGAI